ncbi:hypothetical protein ACFQZE_06900 [Paenibacillus sp. GCM10027627]|uniref:hypothetical protein n=1 Tax=unclassified Paenibacillus TaxID=185978 RepID=UPI00362D13AF
MKLIDIILRCHFDRFDTVLAKIMLKQPIPFFRFKLKHEDKIIFKAKSDPRFIEYVANKKTNGKSKSEIYNEIEDNLLHWGLNFKGLIRTIDEIVDNLEKRLH